MTKNLDKEGLSSIVDDYQLFYVDLWGVVHNGVSLHQEAIKALKDGHHGYTPASGIPPLRQAIADDLNSRHDVTIEPNRILAVPGGKVTMFLAMMIYGEPGCEILYPNPGFPIYESTIRFSGAKPIPIPLREQNGFAFETLGSRIKRVKR